VNDDDGHEIDLRIAHPDEQLSALLDGELAPGEGVAVRQHLEGCEACRDELEAVAAIRLALRDMPVVPAPPGFIGRAVDRRRRDSRRGAVLVLAAAVLAVVVGLVAAGDADPPVGSGEPTEAAVGAATPQVRPSREGVSPGPRLQRWDAGRPDLDAKLSQPARHDPPAGDDDSVLDRAHEVGRELLDLLGG
jgi:anti-sigma factor RsiW